MLKPPAHHLGMHHVALRVHDVTRECAFFVHALGYVVEWAPDADNVYLTSGADNVALHHHTPAHRANPKHSPLDHLGILVADANAVPLWEAYLLHHGATLLASSKRHRDGATSCYVRTPGGIALQMLHHPPITHPLLAAKHAHG